MPSQFTFCTDVQNVPFVSRMCICQVVRRPMWNFVYMAGEIQLIFTSI